MLYRARKRAESKGLPYDLDLNWALERLVEQKYRCATTGLELQLVCPRTNTTYSAFSPSFDRTDSSKGYTRDNTQVVCLMYNNAKNRFYEEDVLRFAEAVVLRDIIGIDNTSNQPLRHYLKGTYLCVN